MDKTLMILGLGGVGTYAAIWRAGCPASGWRWGTFARTTPARSPTA